MVEPMNATIATPDDEEAVGQAPERVFTDYVRALEPGGEPGAAEFARVWRVLQGALRQEMRRRSLFTAPPSFLGVYGWTDWRDPTALDDLTSTCYTYVFITRLRSLRAQLKVKENVDGLVFRNIRNFLHDRQKEHDPVGYRAYQVLRAAVEGALEAGRLEVLEGSGKIGGETLLCLAGHPRDEAPPDDSAELARRRQALQARVAQWNGELLPDLITARGRKRDAVAEELGERLPELAEEDVPVFRFRELLAHMRSDLRERWAAVLWQSRGGMAPREAVQQAAPGGGDDVDTGFVRVLRLYHPAEPPDQEVAARRDFRSLTDCVSSQVAGFQADRRTRRYLETFWQFLRTSVKASEPIPSNRKLSDLLEIPRERLPELYEALAGLVRRCREQLGGGRRETPGQEGGSGAGANPGMAASSAPAHQARGRKPGRRDT